MGASAAAIMEFFGSAGAAEGGAAAAEGATAAAGSGIGTAIAQGAAGAVVGAGLSAALAPKMPAVKAPTPMPVPNDAAAMEARRRMVAALSTRSGRASTTAFSDNSGNVLGG